MPPWLMDRWWDLGKTTCFYATTALFSYRSIGAHHVPRTGPVLALANHQSFFDPVLKGKWGAARLAAATGAPVVPVGMWGTEKVWPRRRRLPQLVTLRPPQITITAGPAVRLGRSDASADTDTIMEAVTALLPPEARERRIPSEEEIRLATPAGS